MLLIAITVFRYFNNGTGIDFIPRYTGITGILPSTNPTFGI